MADEEINEVRKIRHRISAKYGHDIKKLVAHYQDLEQRLRASGQYKFADAKKSAGESERNHSEEPVI